MAATVAQASSDVTRIPTPPLQSTALFIIFFFTALALVVFGLRAFTRLSTRQWGMDDSLITVAMLLSAGMCGPFYLYMKLNYFGWTKEDVPKFDPSPGRLWFYIAQLLYNPILALVKASVLVFLLRLGGGHKPKIRWSIHALNVFNGLQAIAIFLVALLQCIPIEANWDPAVALKAKCIDKSFHITASSLTILTDILVLILPFCIFLGLKMKRAAKVAVLGVFMLGLAVTIIGIIRMVKIIRLFYYPDPKKDPYADISITLNVVEANMAIISASCPALSSLLRSWMPRYFGSSAKYGSAKKLSTGNTFGSSYKSGGGADGTSHLGHAPNSMALKSIRGGGRIHHTECRGVTPSGSKEELFRYNGIMRTTKVQVQSFGSRDGRSMAAADNGNRQQQSKSVYASQA